MPKRSSKKPASPDPNQIAARILGEATGEKAPELPAEPQPEKNPHAQALGRLGGLKGGASRAQKLSKEQRREIATKAAKARWAKRREA